MTSVAEAPPGSSVQLRLLAGTPGSRLDTHLSQHGRMPETDTNQVIGMARDAGLTGRGGAGFPLWRKLTAVAAAGRPAIVIANGAEGEPASGKDQTLLSYAPNLVLDGLQLIAHGARSAVLYVPAATHPALRSLLDQRRSAGLDRVPVTLVAAPDAFVSGEESAVASAVAGKGAVPVDKLVRHH